MAWLYCRCSDASAGLLILQRRLYFPPGLCCAPMPCLPTQCFLPAHCRRYTASRSDSGAHHASVLAAAASIMRDEGPGGYYRGLRTKVRVLC